MVYVLTAYVGRDNYIDLGLIQDGADVEPSAVTRATVTFGSYCLDTDDDTGVPPLTAELVDDAKTVRIRIGLVDGIEVGRYSGTLVIYDSTMTHGLWWADLIVRVREASTCPDGGA